MTNEAHDMPVKLKNFFNRQDKSTRKGQPLPDFLIVGAMKAGSAACARNLRRHPDVFIPMLEDKQRYCQSETHDFDRDYHTHEEIKFFSEKVLFDRGLDWYSRFFNQANNRIKGEKTPIYLYNRRKIANFGNKTCERISMLLPDIKIIILLRDPVSRAFSHWNHMLNHFPDYGTHPGETFFEFLTRDNATLEGNNIVAWSDYYPDVLDYLSVFGKERVYIGIQERIIASRESEYTNMLDFLGASRKRNIKFGIFHKSDYKTRKLDDASIDILATCFRESVIKLRELLDDPLPEWRQYD